VTAATAGSDAGKQLLYENQMNFQWIYKWYDYWDAKIKAGITLHLLRPFNKNCLFIITQLDGSWWGRPLIFDILFGQSYSAR
jgi:hypothetical protein